MVRTKETILKELQTVPGVGKSIGLDLWNLGFRSVRQLKGKDPERLYVRHCIQKGTTVDRCMLYVMRCAVYYASQTRHNPELLLWWNWKDSKQ